jgi:metallo-beta-lactamase family protein
MSTTPTDPPPPAARPPEPAITFWGAASSVSGSMHLVDAGGRRLLLDCGLNQGRRDEARQRNGRFPFHPDQIDAVVISHAHIDHSGNLPTLVRQGFSGPVYVTPSTHDLLAVMLKDSAKIQEEEAAHINIARNYAEPWVQPLYTFADVDRALDRLVSVKYGQLVDLGGGVGFKFIEAGHILGSAMVHMTAPGPEGRRTLTFSGDLGRRGIPLLRPTGDIPPADLLVCESTYGNRTHTDLASTIDKLYAAVSTTVARGGKVLIPAFSLGRTQLIIHFLQRGLRDGKIPKVPIFVDSPLAADIAEVYRSHPDSLSPDVAEAVREGHGVLGGDGVTYVRSYEASQHLILKPGPLIVIASSGMCDAGRIVGHLRQSVDDPRCAVVLVSFQAPGTTGRRLMDNKPTVWMQGKEWNKWIEVVHLDGFSGHADVNDFKAYLGPLAGRVTKVRLIHGEREQAENLADTLGELGFADVAVPQPGDREEWG